MQKFVQLSPLISSNTTIRYEEGSVINYRTFAPFQAYEINSESLLEACIKHKSEIILKSKDKELLELNKLEFEIKEIGCSECHKKRGIDGVLMLVFNTFILIN